jgi:hypothetical protein
VTAIETMALMLKGSLNLMQHPEFVEMVKKVEEVEKVKERD